MVNRICHEDSFDPAERLMEAIQEAKKLALKEHIDANTIVINKNFAKFKGVPFVVGGAHLNLPVMILGLEAYMSDELPDKYSFAVLESVETERTRLIKETEARVVSEVFRELLNVIREHEHRALITEDKQYIWQIRDLASDLLKIKEKFNLENDEKEVSA